MNNSLTPTAARVLTDEAKAEQIKLRQSSREIASNVGTEILDRDDTDEKHAVDPKYNDPATVARMNREGTLR